MTTEESFPPWTPRGRPAAYEKRQGSCKICFAENRKEPCTAGYKGISKYGGGESPKLATRKAASIEVYVGKLYGSEVDFIAMRGNEKIYIQVSDNIAEEATLERELRPLRRIKDAHPKLLVANTCSPSYDIEGIKVVDLPKWLLG